MFFTVINISTFRLSSSKIYVYHSKYVYHTTFGIYFKSTYEYHSKF